MANSIEIDNLSFGYGDEEILKNVSITLPDRSFLVVIGPNGGGKSTFLKVLLGLLTPNKGGIKIFGKAIKETLPLVGYVPQDCDKIKSFPINVIDTVMMGFHNADIGKKEIMKRSIEAIELFGMKGYESYRLNELSTGQRQRVFLAR
ncbi:MAG: ATP-binding cassette domain-containing protein, partial [Deferribacteraceae bacterium]|nr:ATP-binding cassette domain-containing protein [Deferribacteraceae bacterium]